MGTCSRCGAVSDDGDAEGSLPLGWSTATSPRGLQALCDRCTREHVREIEAKLDEAWWS